MAQTGEQDYRTALQAVCRQYPELAKKYVAS